MLTIKVFPIKTISLNVKNILKANYSLDLLQQTDILIRIK